MINGFANRRLNPLGYTRFADLFQSAIPNPKSQIKLARTTGLEPAIFSLKGWRLNHLPTSSKCARRDLNSQPVEFKSTASCQIGLRAPKSLILAVGCSPTTFGFWNQRLLPNWATRAYEVGILLNPQSQIPNPKSSWWTERDSNPYEKFAELLCCLVTSSARKIGVEGGIFTRTSLVLTRQVEPCASHHSATST